MAHVLIAEARFYAHLNDLLLAGARGAIEAAGHSHETVTVPGALELPGAIALAADSGRFDAYVALGVVIRGETSRTCVKACCNMPRSVPTTCTRCRWSCRT